MTWYYIWTDILDRYIRQIHHTYLRFMDICHINPKPFHRQTIQFKFEVVSCWRDPQLQVSENYSDLTKWRSTIFKFCWFNPRLFSTCKKLICNVLKRNVKNKEYNRYRRSKFLPIWWCVWLPVTTIYCFYFDTKHSQIVVFKHTFLSQ